MTSSTPAPTYRTPTATLLRDAKPLAFSSPRLCPLVFLNFVCAASCCLKHPVEEAFFSSLHHLLLVSVHLHQLAVEVARANFGRLVGNAPESPKRSAVRWQKDLCEGFIPSSRVMVRFSTLDD